MGDFKHRLAARAVGWIDLVFAIVQFVILIYLIVESVKMVKGEHVDGDPELTAILKDFSDKELSTLRNFLTFIIGLAAFFTVIQFMAAVALILATQHDRSPKKALRLVRFWRGVNVTFVVLGVIGAIAKLKDGNVLGLAGLLIMILLLVLVHPFIKELEEAV